MQLDGPDLFHLAQERSGHPCHTLKIAVLGGPVDHEHLRTWLDAAVRRLEVLRRRPERRLGLPAVWAQDGRRPHLERHELDARGDERALCDLLSELCGRAVALDQPPWAAHHITGLAGGREAVVLRLHHALADGAAGALLWEQMAGEATAAHVAACTPAATSRVRHLAGSVRELPGLARRWAAHGKRQSTEGSPFAAPFAAPSTRYNRQASGGARRCAFVTLPLDEVRRVSRATDATGHEVYMTLVGGAVRRHLAALGEEPTAPLTGNIPFALPHRHDRYGNAVTSYGISLHSDVVDPFERLRAVRHDLRAVREQTTADPRLLPDSMRHHRLYELLVAGMHLQERRKGRPAFNLIVSSVRGPGPLVIAGVPVAELRSVGPLSGRFGLNLTAWSYGETFTVSLHAYRDAAGHLDELCEAFQAELAELSAVA
jgi:WS/DGAT/MGAT family acyltransferase